MLRHSRKNVMFVLLLTAVFLIIAGCGNSGAGSTSGQTGSSSGTETNNAATDSESSDGNAATEPAATDNSADFKQDNDPIVTITMEDGQQIELELYPKAAPNTVNNFISLINKGFYDGLMFHRTIPGFMIQGGDPDGNGTGGPGYSIPGEFSSNNVDNGLKHTRGILSMARSGSPDSGGSQFFVMVGDAEYLDGQYAAFGKVISGMDEVDKIVNAPADAQDKPETPAVMKTVTVDTKEVEYPEPQKQN